MRKLIYSIFIFSSLIFSSCNFETVFTPDWDEPAKHFFKEYTEKAAIEMHELASEYPQGPDKITYLTSENDVTVTFYLRNPMDFILEPSFVIDEGSSDGVEIIQDPIDRGLIYLTYPQSFLFERDCNNKNISGTVKLFRPKTEQYYESYSYTYKVNSAPPAVQRAIFQADSINGPERKYIVCFYIPELTHESMKVHKNDTRIIFIDGIDEAHKKYFNGGKIYNKAEKNDAGEWIYSEEDSAFTSSVSSCQPLSDGITFDQGGISGYSQVFWTTDDVITDNEVSHTFRIVDDAGFYSETAIKNTAKKLSDPIQETDETKSVDDDTGLYAYTFKHNQETTDGTVVPGEIKYFYTVTETNGINVFAAGSSNVYTGTTVSSDGKTVIQLPSGKYKIDITAAKDYYVTSNVVSVDNISVSGSANIYLSNTGFDNENTGGKSSPFKTIDRALKALENRNDSSLDYHFIIDGGALVKECNEIDLSGLASSVTFERKTDALAAIIKPTGNSSVFNLKSGTFVFKDVTVTGGNSSGNGGGIIIDGANVTFDGITVTGNSVTDVASTSYGGGVYFASGTLNIQGANVIQGNTKVSGETTSLNNLYLKSNCKMTVTGSLEGSSIYVSTEVEPSALSSITITDGYGYSSGGYNAGISPQKYFIGDMASVKLDETGTEAVLAMSGSAIVNPNDYHFDIKCVDSTGNIVTSFASNTDVSLKIKLGVTYGSGTSAESYYYNESDNKIYKDPEFTVLVSSDPVNWDIRLKSDGSDTGVTSTDESITIPAANALPGKYTLYVKLEFFGVSHDENICITGN